MDPGCVFLGANDLSEKAIIPLANLGVAEMGFWHHHAAVVGAIGKAGEIIASMAHLFEYLCPLGCFQ
jgi:hypothetical protein